MVFYRGNRVLDFTCSLFQCLLLKGVFIAHPNLLAFYFLCCAEDPVQQTHTNYMQKPF